ncbi:DUF3899 domain-containing protein [Peribacillus alkalitolerans]|uniref:DUF3899 domain-containing protein n=1 Tax=Peribacillus alkalitolerans TaxID=1550385 RepID=UPI0013D100B8|nr:DUF3899 domain-containing protein [Peribacillus alkalitolerans]
MKRISVSVVGLFALILLTCFILYKQINLVDIINVTFYVSSILIIFSLLLLVLEKGFFDVISHSFRLLFSRNNKKRFGHLAVEEEEKEISRLSDFITFDYSWTLWTGIILMGFMLVGLLFYYQ